MGKYDHSLAQFLSKRREHTPIGEGAARKAFYSPTHRVVFKVSRYDDWRSQQEAEIKFFKHLSKRQRQHLPTIEVIDYKGEPVIVMEKVTIHDREGLQVHFSDNVRAIEAGILQYGRRNGVDISNAKGAARLIKKYNIADLKGVNIGTIGTRFVIIDTGIFYAGW